MKIDLQLERYQINSGGFAPDPWILDFKIVHVPGDSDRYPVGIPTKTGEKIDWTEATRSQKWIAVPDVEKHWILTAEAKPVKPEAKTKQLKKAIKTGADLTGQLTASGLPIQSWLIGDVLEVGAELLDLDQYLEEPFARGTVDLEGQPESPIKIELTAPREINPPSMSTRETWEKNEFTDMNNGDTVIPAEDDRIRTIKQGESQGFVEVSVSKW